MNRCIQVLILFIPLFTLVSCQLPTGLEVPDASLTPTRAITPTQERAPLTVLAVGLEAPTWESHKTSVANAEGSGALDHTYAQIKTREKVIAITFDDGPHPSNTPRLLDMLKERGIRSTFYVVGNMVRRHSSSAEIMQRMIAEGHEIGNHTVTHGTLSRMNDEQVRSELKRAHDQIVAATNIPPTTMRPPGGSLRIEQRKMILREFGYPTILWSCDPQDWRKPGPSVVAQRLIDGAYPGGILLVHDLHKATIDAMPYALDQLLAKGYTFVTISELISMDQSTQ